ncbi:MAG TPA: hypothetical protein VKK79_14435, partial [Candidatus Lokiarchaeia archaeon]|nr:hypothetical protein [Candidatus Lokiarchaeia archaeon]
ELMEEVLKADALTSHDWRDFNWITPTIHYQNLTHDQLVKCHSKAYTEVPNFTHPMGRFSRILRARGFSFYIRRGLNLGTIKGILKVIRNSIIMAANKEGK